jgi:hypothetical protein
MLLSLLILLNRGLILWNLASQEFSNKTKEPKKVMGLETFLKTKINSKVKKCSTQFLYIVFQAKSSIFFSWHSPRISIQPIISQISFFCFVNIEKADNNKNYFNSWTVLKQSIFAVNVIKLYVTHVKPLF